MYISNIKIICLKFEIKINNISQVISEQEIIVCIFNFKISQKNLNYFKFKKRTTISLLEYVTAFDWSL